MRQLLICFALLCLPLNSIAEFKIMTCTDGSEKNLKVLQSIFDTNDFGKENPQHEGTLVSWTLDGVDGNTHLADSLRVLGGSYSIGKAYRTSFSVTPTTLTFKFKIAEIKASLNYLTLNVSRKDLSIPDGQCSIEDYKPSNAI